MLTIENLHAQVEGKTILKGIDLDVKAGEVHAIMGPNGSGKSTLSSVVAGNEDYEVTKGKILLKGKDLAEFDPEERAHLGVFLSFQYPVEIPGVTVTNFIKTAINANRKAQGIDEIPASELLKKIREKSKMLGIDSKFLSRSLNEGFSGGEKKRSEVLQMAVLKPKISILDEPDSGLDIDAVQAVAKAISEVSDKDSTTIVITHYARILNFLDKLDHVHVFADGKILKSGDASLAQELEKRGYDWVLEETK